MDQSLLCLFSSFIFIFYFIHLFHLVFQIYFMIVVHSYIEALREDPSGASAGFPRAHVYQTQMVTRFTSRAY